MYWALVTRWELGFFEFGLLLFISAVFGLALWAVVVLLLDRVVLGDAELITTRPAQAFVPVAMLVVLGGALWLSGTGRVVGGLVAFDAQGQPERATVQSIFRTGGKVRIDHLMMRAIGAGGATRAIRGGGYGTSRKLLDPAPVFWSDDTLIATGSLAVAASGSAVRDAVEKLRGVESRFQHVEEGVAIFERRDGETVRVAPSEVVELATFPPPGCQVDVQLLRTSRDQGLIDPERVPWATPAPGCPSRPPPGLQLLLSDDAAFGDVQALVTLREGETTRWQAVLEELVGSGDARLVGASRSPTISCSSPRTRTTSCSCT